MEVPVGFISKLWIFFKFLPFFFLLFVLATLKALVIGPITSIIIAVGNSAVIVGLWPAHFIWTCYCVARTKKLGMVLKVLVLLLLPVPLFLWPVVGILGSFLGGIGFGYFAPLLATFEAVGENVTEKFYHCMLDGCWSTIKEGCTVVRDFTDFCFHSYFSYMDDLIKIVPANEKPLDIMLSRVPSCLFVSLLALVVDVPSVTAVALWKSPYMLFTGWKRLLEDLVGREGPFLETVCVPFAGLAILLWPLAVVGAIIASFLSSFLLGFYAGVIVHQENSIRMGLAYIVAIVSHFDEYANDLLYLKAGSRLPRPRYRKNVNSSSDSGSCHSETNDVKGRGRDRTETLTNAKLESERSRTLKGKIQHYMPIKILDWLFKSCEVNGRELLRDGLIDAKDIEECVVKGNCKKLGIVLPTWCIIKCLLASAKSDTPGLVISDGDELMISDMPRDKMLQRFIGPLLIMKEQIRKLNLDENEETCLRQAVLGCKVDKLEDWDHIEFPSKDPVRIAQLQSVVRRLQGIVGSMARMPTFRRRFQNLVKMMYIEAAKTGTLADYVVESSNDKPMDMTMDENDEQSQQITHDIANIV